MICSIFMYLFIYYIVIIQTDLVNLTARDYEDDDKNKRQVRVRESIYAMRCIFCCQLLRHGINKVEE
jgi:hypothetical protein